MKDNKKTVYEVVLGNILDHLAKGVVPWRKRWNGTFPHNFVSGREYNGINYFILAAHNIAACASYKQILAKGGKVKKGCKQVPVVYWNFIEKEDKETKKIKKIPFARYFKVIPISDTEGIDEATIKQDTVSCDAVLNIMPNAPEVRHNSIVPRYNHQNNVVEMPDMSAFESPEAYHGEFFRVLVDIATSRICPSNNVLLNELTRELGGAFLCSKCNIDDTAVSAASIAKWYEAIKANPRLMTSAASRAFRVVNYILGKGVEKETSVEVEVKEDNE